TEAHRCEQIAAVKEKVAGYRAILRQRRTENHNFRLSGSRIEVSLQLNQPLRVSTNVKVSLLVAGFETVTLKMSSPSYACVTRGSDEDPGAAAGATGGDGSALVRFGEGGFPCLIIVASASGEIIASTMGPIIAVTMICANPANGLSRIFSSRIDLANMTANW